MRQDKKKIWTNNEKRETCTKHNMFSANARNIVVDNKNLCDLIEKNNSRYERMCV